MRVVFRDGKIKHIQAEVGGGMFIGDKRYEVHVLDEHGDDETLMQDEIEGILDHDGKEIYWGNPYMPGHRHTPEEMKAIAKANGKDH